MNRTLRAACILLLGGCAAPTTQPRPQMDPAPIARDADPVLPSNDVAPADRAARVLLPEDAFARGLMPLGSTGVPAFAAAHPQADGRGILIAILDSGIDPSVLGLQQTSHGLPKILDVRDFSGEGRVALAPVTRRGDTVFVAGQPLLGASRIAGYAAKGSWWVGVLDELPLGKAPAADLNGNGTVGDHLPVIVVQSATGWVLFVDRQGNGTFADDVPLRDYAVARDYFGWSSTVRAPGLQMAVNLADSAGVPLLDLVFDNSSHGTHVAGIAAGHDIYGVRGFDGVAPGAQVLALKISNNAQGGITVTGSIIRALEHAIRFASTRSLPLVVNLSFGVGNEVEGTARIDAMMDSLLALHPDVVVTVAAGNDGPGLSTLGFPGSANRVVSVGATQPLVFSGLAPDDVTPEPMAPFSSRGGEAAGPDIAVPGTAYSTIPNFAMGDEIASGTSMAAPHAAGFFARLLSAIQPWERLPALTLRELLRSPRAGSREVESGVWLPDLGGALNALLAAGHTTTPLGESRIARGQEPATGQRVLATALTATDTVTVPAGETRHFFIPAEAGRAFQVEVATGSAEQMATASLHEPGGMPFREGSAIPAAFGDGAALYEVAGHDVVSGNYEIAVVAGPLGGAQARVTVRRAPLTLTAAVERDSLRVRTTSLADAALSVRIRAGFVGVERRIRIQRDDDRPARVAIPVPSWAEHATIDATMGRDAWPRFTDFGVTMQDRHGRQIDAQPMNYAFVRASPDLPPEVRGDSLIILLSPAFADRSAPWTLDLSIRLYAGDVTEIGDGGAPFAPLTARKTQQTTLRLGTTPYPMAAGFRQLVIVVALEGDTHAWMHEFSLDPVGGSSNE